MARSSAGSPAGSPAGRRLRVEEVGAQVTVQDLGRPGLAHLGVPRSGALDGPAHRLANRLVGNAEDAATLECLDGRLAFTPSVSVAVAVTGAQVPVIVDGRAKEWGTGLPVPSGARVEVGAATSGLRAYVAVAGGIAVDPVLGSRATDLLSGLGPPPVEAGDELALGATADPPVAVDTPRPPRRTGVLRVRLGTQTGLVRARVAGRPGRLVVRRGQLVEPDRPAPGGRGDRVGEQRGAAERGDGARRGAGAAQRAAGRVPARPPDDRRLPGDRGGPGR